MSELKPCPFCGAKARLLDKTSSVGTYKWVYWFVRCGGCGAENGWNEKKHKAIEAWNRRAEDGKND